MKSIRPKTSIPCVWLLTQICCCHGLAGADYAPTATACSDAEGSAGISHSPPSLKAIAAPAAAKFSPPAPAHPLDSSGEGDLTHPKPADPRRAMSAQALSSLQEATQGLLYMSESDFPFEGVHWENVRGPLDQKRLLALTHHKEGTPVREMSLHDFFKNLVQEKPWYGRIEKEKMRRYQRLLSVIQENLSDVKVFFVGKVNVDIYLVGKGADGDWVGIKTRAVET